MDIVRYLTPLLGSWQGENRFRLMPTDDFKGSAATGTVTVTAAHFATVAYTWSDGESPQEGLLLLAGGMSDADPATAVWADSWHTGRALMQFAGTVGGDGVLRLHGSYAAPSGPDWGWQIHIHPGEGGGGRLTMHNVVPGEDPYQVVELALER
ncbi:DUF1579 family protein [Arthrobacter sp. ov118]|uniref:DUF1579 family protein n=1 Tax=Arthrobacter sp. ov118 TaxID=1761747 RepID=UPI0008EC99FF|nr:DUF1579 family protein [Arthrobacter sp. ov118]SFT67432.1 Protein of unknown function [Arthrobacter sp. ov118]